MELETGNIDCIWNGFTMNGREENYTWSDPYMDNTQIFVVAPDSGIATLADLTGKVVEVQVDSSAQAALADMPELADTFKDLVVTPDYNTAFMDHSLYHPAVIPAGQLVFIVYCVDYQGI